MDNRFETFTLLVNRISRSIRRIKIQEMAEYGLRGAHISCLYHLYLAGPLTATDLCERCEEDKATISRALPFLEENGYLTPPQRQALPQPAASDGQGPRHGPADRGKDRPRAGGRRRRADGGRARRLLQQPDRHQQRPGNPRANQ